MLCSLYKVAESFSPSLPTHYLMFYPLLIAQYEVYILTLKSVLMRGNTLFYMLFHQGKLLQTIACEFTCKENAQVPYPLALFTPFQYTSLHL